MERRSLPSDHYRIGAVLLVAGLTMGCFFIPDDFEPDPEPEPTGECDGETAIPSVVDEDFTANDDCETIDETIVVEAGRLSIEPGTTLEFEADAGLRVVDDGALYARGSDEEPIELKPAGNQTWKGLYFDGTTNRDNILEGVTVREGGSEVWDDEQPAGPAGLTVRAARLEVQNIELRDGAGFGLALADDTDLSMSGDNQITGHAGEPVHTSPGLVDALTAETTYQNNDSDYIVVTEGEVDKDGVWEEFDVPILITGTVTIAANLRIAGGNELVFGDGAGFEIDEGGDVETDAGEDDEVTVRDEDGDTEEVLPERLPEL